MRAKSQLMGRLFNTICKAFLPLAIMASAPGAYAAFYTAATSGNFSAGSTWQGGIAPSFNLSGDVIVIPTGIVVTLDGSLKMTNGGPSDMLSIDGMLGGNTYSIRLDGVLLQGTGTILVDTFSGDFTGGNFSFSGNIDANLLDGGSIVASNIVTFNVANRLYLDDTMVLKAGTIKLDQSGKIEIHGSAAYATPLLTVEAGANLNLPTSYEVIYKGTGVKAGQELGGTGLTSLVIDLDNGTDEVDLGTNVTLNGLLALTKGTLDFNGHDFTFDTNSGLVNSQGIFKVNTPSMLHIKPATALTGELRFVNGGNTLSNLTLNTSGTIALGSPLKIANLLDLQNGKLDVQGNKLSLITGATVIHASANSYVVTGTGGFMAADIAADSNFMYPVGTAAAYAPCTISSNNNTVYNGFGVAVNAGVLAMGTSGPDMSTKQPMVGLTWFAYHSSTGMDIDMQVAWDASQEKGPFDRANCYVSQLVGSWWDKIQDTNAVQAPGGLWTVNRTGIRSLSAFAVFDNTTVDVQGQPLAKRLNVHPNPATHTLMVPVTAATDIAIYNAQGQRVIYTRVNAAAHDINIEQLPAGMYLVRAGDGSVATFVKQ